MPVLAESIVRTLGSEKIDTVDHKEAWTHLVKTTTRTRPATDASRTAKPRVRDMCIT